MCTRFNRCTGGAESAPLKSADRLSMTSQMVAFLPTPAKIFSQEFTLVGFTTAQNLSKGLIYSEVGRFAYTNIFDNFTSCKLLFLQIVF